MENRSKQIPRITVREDFKEGAMHQAWGDSQSDCRQRIDGDIELSLKQKWDSVICMSILRFCPISGDFADD